MLIKSPALIKGGFIDWDPVVCLGDGPELFAPLSGLLLLSPESPLQTLL